MNRAVVIYTCDRCRITAEVVDDRKLAEPPPPHGWTRITFEAMDGADLAEAIPPAYEICGSCFTEHLLRVLAPVERVRDIVERVRDTQRAAVQEVH